MGADFDYAEACHPDRWTVLGVRLQHFRVGHLLLLERSESPFVAGGDVGSSELLAAVWVCGNTYKKGARGLFEGMSLLWRFWTWRKALALEFKKDLLKRETEKLAAYIAHARRPIASVYHDVEAGKSYAPFVLVLVRDLSRYAPEQVLEMPLRQALFEREGYLETVGATTWDEPMEGAL